MTAILNVFSGLSRFVVGSVSYTPDNNLKLSPAEEEVQQSLTTFTGSAGGCNFVILKDLPSFADQELVAFDFDEDGEVQYLVPETQARNFAVVPTESLARVLQEAELLQEKNQQKTVEIDKAKAENEELQKQLALLRQEQAKLMEALEQKGGDAVKMAADGQLITLSKQELLFIQKRRMLTATHVRECQNSPVLTRKVHFEETPESPERESIYQNEVPAAPLLRTHIATKEEILEACASVLPTHHVTLESLRAKMQALRILTDEKAEVAAAKEQEEVKAPEVILDRGASIDAAQEIRRDGLLAEIAKRESKERAKSIQDEIDKNEKLAKVQNQLIKVFTKREDDYMQKISASRKEDLLTSAVWE